MKKKPEAKRESARGFTLVELLIVIAIIAVLAVVIVFVINPFQLIAQVRDSQRLSDANTIISAVTIYQTQNAGSLGNTSTTYVSIPDLAATTTAGTDCSTIGLPFLAGGMVYHCAASSSYRSIDATGWIPINFHDLEIKSPITVLPVDPVNTSSSGYYYRYIVGKPEQGGGYEVEVPLQSAKYQDINGGISEYIEGPNPALANPVMFITNPTYRQIETGDFTITIFVQYPRPIKQIDFFIDGVSLGVATVPPYQKFVTLNSYAPGDHVINVKLTDTSGNLLTTLTIFRK